MATFEAPPVPSKTIGDPEHKGATSAHAAPPAGGGVGGVIHDMSKDAGTPAPVVQSMLPSASI